MSEPHTYFIYDSSTHTIKIGSSVNVANRLKALQTSNPCKLQLLGWVEENIEKRLHRKFIDTRVTGEWFRADVELLQYINSSTDIKDCEHTTIDNLLKQTKLLSSTIIDPVKTLRKLKQGEILCHKVWDISNEDDATNAQFELWDYVPDDLYACCMPDDDLSQEELDESMDMCDSGDYICDYHMWLDAVNELCDHKRVRRIGINDEAKMIHATVHAVCTTALRDWVTNRLPEIGMTLDDYGWNLEASIIDNEYGVKLARANCARLWVEFMCARNGNFSGDGHESGLRAEAVCQFLGLPQHNEVCEGER